MRMLNTATFSPVQVKDSVSALYVTDAVPVAVTCAPPLLALKLLQPRPTEEGGLLQGHAITPPCPGKQNAEPVGGGVGPCPNASQTKRQTTIVEASTEVMDVRQMREFLPSRARDDCFMVVCLLLRGLEVRVGWG